jgi:hypothetical protein
MRQNRVVLSPDAGVKLEVSSGDGGYKARYTGESAA